ncbi:MAG: DMT family transporter [Trueperaceae bacterium]|nr:DMT family transporter [Trueperaceae bacterium]
MSESVTSESVTSEAERADQERGRTRVFLVLGVGVLAVSFAAIFIRLAEAPGVVVAAYRMLIASLIILPWTVRALRRTPLTRHNLGYTLLAGLFLGAHFATWITSLSFTSVAASVTLVTTNPLWVALFSWLFIGLAPSMSVLAGVLVAVLGGALIGFDSGGVGSNPLLGNLLALTGAICASAYFLLGRAAQRRGLSLQAYVGVAYGVAALVLLPLPLVFGFDYGGYPLATFSWILLLALVPQLIGHTSFNYAVKHLDPTLVATVILLEPIGSSLFALVLFSEVPSLLTIVGAAILLVGVGLTTRHTPNRRETRRPPEPAEPVAPDAD